jgi:hypothetical protein
LQPGRYLVEIYQVRSTSPQILRASVVVQSGKATPVVIRGRAAVQVPITFRDLGPANPDRQVQVFCRDEQGQLDAVLKTYPEGPTPLVVQEAFAPGRYQLECQVDDGRVVTAELVVPSLAQAVQLTIDLPAR